MKMINQRLRPNTDDKSPFFIVVWVSSAAVLVTITFGILQQQLFVWTKRLYLRSLRQKKISSCFHQLRNYWYLLQIKKWSWEVGEFWNFRFIVSSFILPCFGVLSWTFWVLPASMLCIFLGCVLWTAFFCILCCCVFILSIGCAQIVDHVLLISKIKYYSYLEMDHLIFKGVCGWFDISTWFFYAFNAQGIFSQNVCTCMIFFYVTCFFRLTSWSWTCSGR